VLPRLAAALLMVLKHEDLRPHDTAHGRVGNPFAERVNEADKLFYLYKMLIGILHEFSVELVHFHFAHDVLQLEHDALLSWRSGDSP
jgi:hypothetical protein